MKRIKTGENYAETITAMSEDVSTSSTAKLKEKYNKSSIKASVNNVVTYYFLKSQPFADVLQNRSS